MLWGDPPSDGMGLRLWEEAGCWVTLGKEPGEQQDMEGEVWGVGSSEVVWAREPPQGPRFLG